MAVTMKDVAERAGVSKSTVSQYLNKRFNYMSNSTRMTIEKAIEELGYRPNLLARSLTQKTTNLVAIVAANLSSTFTTELIAAVEEIMAAKGIDVIVASTGDDPKKEKAQLESLITRQVDGVIVFPTIDNTDFYNGLVKRKYPLVFVDREITEVAVNTVLLDNETASKMATEELIKNGHTKIGIISFPLGKDDSITTRKERLNGYKKTLLKHNLTIDKDYIKIGNQGEMNRCLTELLESESAPTAVIATNDMLLESLLLWLKTNQVKIPSELSIVGIDDVSFASFYHVGITTVSQPIKQIGKKAAELLLEQINNQGDSLDSETYKYLPTLNIRESVSKHDGDIRVLKKSGEEDKS